MVYSRFGQKTYLYFELDKKFDQKVWESTFWSTGVEILTPAGAPATYQPRLPGPGFENVNPGYRGRGLKNVNPGYRAPG